MTSTFWRRYLRSLTGYDTELRTAYNALKEDRDFWYHAAHQRMNQLGVLQSILTPEQHQEYRERNEAEKAKYRRAHPDERL